MRRFSGVVLTAVIGFILTVGVACAADMPAKAPIFKAPIAYPYNWTGFYVGGNVGVGVSGASTPTDPTAIIGTGNGDTDGLFSAGFTGGVQAGYNWQFSPNWVVGIEGDVGTLLTNRSICDINDCNAAENIHITSKSDFFSTLRGRVGYAWDRSLFYVTGGAAWVGLKDSWTISGEYSEVSKIETGWTVGAGVETALHGNWTLKTEYLFVDPGDVKVLRSNGDGSYLTFQHQMHVIRLGLNYKFGEEWRKTRKHQCRLVWYPTITGRDSMSVEIWVSPPRDRS